MAPPLAVLVVSGGHTARGDHGRRHALPAPGSDGRRRGGRGVRQGRARLLGLGYPGGPVIDRLAAQGIPAAIRFPRPMFKRGLRLLVLGAQDRGAQPRAPSSRRPRGPGSRGIVPGSGRRRAGAQARRGGASSRLPTRWCIGGGVAANSRLRARVVGAAEASGRRVLLPDLALCTDNGAMIAATAWWRLGIRRPHPAHHGRLSFARPPDPGLARAGLGRASSVARPPDPGLRPARRVAALPGRVLPWVSTPIGRVLTRSHGPYGSESAPVGGHR